jgi:hypothetical protein
METIKRLAAQLLNRKRPESFHHENIQRYNDLRFVKSRNLLDDDYGNLNDLDDTNDPWITYTDDDFTRDFHPSDISPQQAVISQLCEDCTNTCLSFRRSVRLSQLRKTTDSCSLCGVLWERLDLGRYSPTIDKEFNLVRRHSVLMSEGTELPVLRICTHQGADAAPADVQVDFPMLPEVGSPIHFKLLREWLRVCDKDHDCSPESNTPLPTRVLDVGNQQNPELLRLYFTKGARGKYIALSHCWGKLKENEKFCTYRHNITALRQGIDFNKLPKNFQDAITVTRGLGERFLWIDSLCIIQEDKDDWDKESKRMEMVFGSAYCTIAASSAKSSLQGFLNPRLPKQCASVPNASNASLYFCENIDNFHRDVEEGELSKRGWVFQERALSRRTIHFTKEQTYWECGDGVRCESLHRLYK